jgi:hypothetical protein
VISFNRAAKGSESGASAFDPVCTTHTIQVIYTMHMTGLAAHPIHVRQRLSGGVPSAMFCGMTCNG